MNKRYVVSSALGLICFLGVSGEALAQHKGISFQAVMKRSDGSYPTVSGITVTAQILDPINHCVLREEEHTGKNISNGYLNLVLGDSAASTPTARNPSPILSLGQVLDNKTQRTSLKCVDQANNITTSGGSYSPSNLDRRILRIRLNLQGEEIAADFNMRAVGFAVNSEMLNSKSDDDFVNINNNKGVTKSNVESIFDRFTKLDAILNSFDNTGASAGFNISGNAATATNVSGTVAIAHGGTGATTASVARDNLGLGSLATINTNSDNTTYLRGDGTWQTVSVPPTTGSTSITTLGTVTTGTWNGSAIPVAHGGTGTSTGSISGTGALTFTAGGTNTNVNLVPQGTGTVDVASKKITNLATPTAATDAATKAYVDAASGGSSLSGGFISFLKDDTWTVPAGVTKINVLIVGGGGGASGISYGGGGGGGSCIKDHLGDVLSSADGGNGGDSMNVGSGGASSSPGARVHATLTVVPGATLGIFVGGGGGGGFSFYGGMNGSGGGGYGACGSGGKGGSNKDGATIVSGGSGGPNKGGGGGASGASIGNSSTSSAGGNGSSSGGKSGGIGGCGGGAGSGVSLRSAACKYTEYSIEPGYVSVVKDFGEPGHTYGQAGTGGGPGYVAIWY